MYIPRALALLTKVVKIKSRTAVSTSTSVRTWNTNSYRKEKESICIASDTFSTLPEFIAGIETSDWPDELLYLSSTLKKLLMMLSISVASPNSMVR